MIISIVVFIIILFVIFDHISTNKKIQKENHSLISQVTDINRGEPSEIKLILFLLKSGIPAQNIFHDLYVNIRKDKFSQIDIVLLTKVGIIVFEVKNYSGWLFGRGNQDKWTQVLNYGRDKYRFYNPVIQNIRHVDILQKLVVEQIPFFSVIVFFGDSELKDITMIPKNTFVTKGYRVLEVVDNIINQNNVIEYKNKDKIVEMLKIFVKKGSVEKNRVSHIDNINDMLGTDRVFK